MYYFCGKSNRGRGICLLYRGCLPLGESVIRGFTVVKIVASSWRNLIIVSLYRRLSPRLFID